MKTQLAIFAVAVLCLASTVTGRAAVRYVNVNNPMPVSPYTNWATAATVIQDAIDVALPGDEIVVTNGVYQTGERAVYGTMTNRVAVTKSLTVRSVNGPEVTVIRGYQLPGTTNGDGAVRCVYLTNGATLAGFTLTNGATRGLNIEEITHENVSGGGVWCESTGACVSNCVIAGNAAAFGGGAHRGTLLDCIVSSNVATGGGGGAFYGVLHNCTLTGNLAAYGGAVEMSTLFNCTLTTNLAWYGGGAVISSLHNCNLFGNVAVESGGGAAGYPQNGSDLSNCILAGNSAAYGGGVAGGLLNNCTLVANSASQAGGGVFGEDRGPEGCASIACVPDPGSCPLVCLPRPVLLNNCILYDNMAPIGANYSGYASMAYSCTMPQPATGAGNITNAPLFLDTTAGNFRLQSNSPCINAGRNAHAHTGPDLDGNARIAGGTVDIGAFEFQSPQSTISYAWLQQYGLPTDGSADFTDLDGDGHNNWQEWRAWTEPTNAISVLRLLTPSTSTNGLLVRWQSVSGQTYFLERATNLAAQTSFVPFASSIVGQAGTTVFTDTNTVSAGPFFYRVGVSE